MKHDAELDIAIGLGARSKVWKNQKWSWSSLVKKLTTEYKTGETFQEFISATKGEQGKIKDIGGYVGGYLRNGRRKPENIVHRQLLTLDIDDAHKDFWDDFVLQFDNAAVLHSTHKHHPTKPRFRLIMPLKREVSADEYVAVARKVAGILGIELFDNTTFETNRLMFWPSTPKDMAYYSEFQDGPWLDPDKVLAEYTNWKDSSEWPTAKRTIDHVRENSEKQADPEEKKGIVGVFCRTYPVEDAIATFLGNVYKPAGDGRYSYLKGTTSAGLTLYDGKFAYSHHGTDPISGHLCNAFDLVRVHKFGHLDAYSQPDGVRSKSFKAMEDFAREDKRVKKIIATEKFAEIKYDFAEPPDEDDQELEVDWATELEVDSKSKYLSTATNLNIIFANDPNLKGVFKQNLFDNKLYVFRNLPWRKIKKPEPIKNVDFSGVRNYIETVYGISGNTKIDDALALQFEKHAFHPVKEYLDGLAWDGIPRLDTLLADYFGAQDNIYTREAMSKMMIGAVARIYRPGIKFDLVLTIVGEQGTGKSTFISKLGGPWFSDTFLTVQGKEALEQIQGAWLIEIAELAGLRKAEVEAIKHFISKQVDMFRPAYARAAETFYRQCVFVGTTNNKDFLRDPSGNRRFLPVGIYPAAAKFSVFSTEDFDANIDQFWAEAKARYDEGERLYLSPQAERLARVEQGRHSETDERAGLVHAFLETLLPDNWETMDIYERRMFLEDPGVMRGRHEREYVCVAEIWCECLGKNKEDMSRYNTRELNDIMRTFTDWEAVNTTRSFKLYGTQKYYARKLD